MHPFQFPIADLIDLQHRPLPHQGYPHVGDKTLYLTQSNFGAKKYDPPHYHLFSVVVLPWALKFVVTFWGFDLSSTCYGLHAPNINI